MPVPVVSTTTTSKITKTLTTRQKQGKDAKKSTKSANNAQQQQYVDNPFLSFAQHAFQTTWRQDPTTLTSTTKTTGNPAATLKATKKLSPTPNDKLSPKHATLRDFALKIAAYLGNVQQLETSDASLKAFMCTSKQIMEKLDAASGASVGATRRRAVSATTTTTVQARTLKHTIDPMQLIKEIKRSAKEQIRELFILRDTTTSDAAKNTSDSEQPITSAEPDTSAPPNSPQKIRRQLKMLPALAKLTHIRIESLPQHSASVQILQQIMKTSPLKRVETVSAVLDEELTRAMALKNTVKRLEILPSMPQQESQIGSDSNEQTTESSEIISPQQRYEDALAAFFTPSSEDQISVLQSVYLRNISLSVIQSMIHLRLSALHIENDAQFSNAAQSEGATQESDEQVVPRLSSLRECTITSNDSSFVRHILFTICPANLERLQIGSSTGSEPSLISFDAEAVQQLGNLKQLHLTNVAPASIQHLLDSAHQSIQRVYITFSVPETKLENKHICSLAKCGQLSTITISSAHVSNQFFIILGEYKSSTLRGLTMNDVRWFADPDTNWERPSAQEDTDIAPGCSLQAAWFDNVTFKAQTQEEDTSAQKGGAKKAKPPAKGKGAPVDEESEDGGTPNDADFASLCAAAPRLECLVLRKSNIGDAHLEVLGASPLRTSLETLEISNSSRPVLKPKLTSQHQLSALRRLYIYSDSKADYVSLEALITLVLISPQIECVQLVPQFPTKRPVVKSSIVFTQMDEYAQQTRGSMWGVFLKESVFRREIVPRIVAQLEEIYRIERDRSIVRGALNRILGRTSGLGGSERWEVGDSSGRILRVLFDAVFGVTGVTYD